MLTYGDVQYSWTHGKMLSEITDGENTYEYKYDTNGIRGEKVINGQRTIINSLNGTVCSQHDIDNNNVMYFQYSAGTPLGFQLNDVQYLYITNLSGDVVGITDLDGNVLAEYAYDEWGKLLEITADSAENKALAELNPLRYRGYYYDNETGMYYLQSRYYSPDLCRFISADDFDYIDTMSFNAYIYCENNPISYSDPTGYFAEIAAGSGIAALLEALAGVLGVAVSGLTVALVVVVTILLVYLISSISSNFVSNSYTKTLSDVKAKKQVGKHYKIAYINNNGALITIGGNLSFVQALAALGITASGNDISRRYKFSYNRSKVSGNVRQAYDYNQNKWGIYADTKVAAKALAVVLGSTEPPEVHGSGFYGHYHDKNHNIHIWYGLPISY